MIRTSLILSCILALPVAAPFPAAAAKNPKPRDCDTANACLQQLRAASGNKSGLDPDDEALVARLLSFSHPFVSLLHARWVSSAMPKRRSR